MVFPAWGSRTHLCAWELCPRRVPGGTWEAERNMAITTSREPQLGRGPGWEGAARGWGRPEEVPTEAEKPKLRTIWRIFLWVELCSPSKDMSQSSPLPCYQ